VSPANTQPRGSPAPSPAPKFSPVAPKFTPVASKFSPGAPGGPGSQPNQKLGPPEAPSSTSTGSPQPPSFIYAQQREKPRVQEKQHPAPPPVQNQSQVRDWLRLKAWGWGGAMKGAREEWTGVGEGVSTLGVVVWEYSPLRFHW
jgi:hypothetical protein